MKISIRYYSGAGNTKFIAKKIVTSLKNGSHRVIDKKITEGRINRGNDDFHLLGVGFPIHFREAPELIYDFLRSLEGKNRPIFFFATKGLYSGNAIRNAISFSKRQNFKPVGFVEFFMPGTDFLILFAKKDSILEKLLKRIHSRNLDVKIQNFTLRLQRATPALTPLKKWYTLFDDVIVKPFEVMYDNCHKAYIGQFHSNPDTCTECMRCVTGCPRNNITYNGKIAFGINCDVCFYCIHNCPTDAIQIANITEGNVRYSRVELL